MRDSAHNLKVVPALAPATYTADATGITVDRLGFNSLTFALAIGAAGDALTGTRRLDFLLTHSDDGVTFDPVGPDNVIGVEGDENGLVLSLRDAHPAPTVTRIGYVDGTIGQRRYVRLSLDAVGTHATGTGIAATAILGHPRQQPVI